MQTQAQFSYAIAKEVIGLRDFCFISLQPDVKCRRDVAWNRGYALAIRYLQELGMKTTLATIEREFRSSDIPTDTTFLEDEFASRYLGVLAVRTEPEPFPQQVAHFYDTDVVESPKPKSPKVLTPSANRLKEQLQLSTGRDCAPEKVQTDPKRRPKK
jgi:hypothetical protein